jgi:type IV pilus assembly protein PilB
MNRPRLGEMLRRMGKLSTIDVDEILFEQSVVPGRFGDIAISWGLCQPRDICQAWCDQIASGNDNGWSGPGQVDPAAAAAIPPDLARRLGIMPLRLIAGQLVIASAEPLDSVAMAELVRLARRDVRLVHASREHIASAIEAFYGSVAEAAA